MKKEKQKHIHADPEFEFVAIGDSDEVLAYGNTKDFALSQAAKESLRRGDSDNDVVVYQRVSLHRFEKALTVKNVEVGGK